MMELSLSGSAEAACPDTTIYLEKDIFFNARVGRLESVGAVVALNFRECILLRLLLSDRVRKQAVIDAAWGDNGVVVTDASYHQLVRSLRKKFEEIGLPAQSIKTLPRFGLEYLREYPQLEVAGAAEAALAPALGAIVSTPSVGAATQVLRWRGMSGGAKWSIRLLSLLLPFLAGLLIGHLGNRSDDVSMPMPVASDAVSRDPALNALRAPSAPQRSNASENRSQRT